jgi:S1-C subfamily serine protease
VKVTKGIISSLTGIGNNCSNIQIDAALQPGNSGGPILDEGETWLVQLSQD